jgi:hypothetical protein
MIGRKQKMWDSFVETIMQKMMCKNLWLQMGLCSLIKQDYLRL